MNNFRPVSNVSFMSKIIERAVAIQLTGYLAANDLLPRYQSAYRRCHSTETALLRIWSDVMMAADERKVTLLSLLDMSAAFDCVDHQILLHRLTFAAGMSGTAIQWIESFLSGRTQQVFYNGRLSTISPVLYGVPQGSTLGPLLYILYKAELSHIIARHGLCHHLYADDVQLYHSSRPDEAAATVDRLCACLIDVDAWLRASRLRLNANKTQIMWLGSRQQVSKVGITEVAALSSSVQLVDEARNLGVILDGQLTLSAQVAAVCRNGYYQLRQLRPLTSCMSGDIIKTLALAFVTSRLDYCNSLYYGVTDRLMSRLQSVQNAAARLVSGLGRRDHITPTLRRLHWLPVRQRVNFKLATLVFRSLAGTAPAYISDDCQLVPSAGRRSLRSSDSQACLVRRSHNHYGDRCFAAAGPVVWNSLPVDLRQPNNTYGSFKRSLKTFLFL
jgi:hypothetical protein